MRWSANAITAIQDAYVQKVIEYAERPSECLWEISERASAAGSTWWQGHIISVIIPTRRGTPFSASGGLADVGPWTTANDPTL